MKIAIIGGGNMGTAFAAAFEKSGLVNSSDILIVEILEERRSFLESEYGWKTQSDIDSNVSDADWLVIAVKPQNIVKPCADLADVIKPEQLIISVVTGVRINRFKEMLGTDRIVRCMPNTPVLVRKGVTVFTVSEAVSSEEYASLEKVLKDVGLAVKVDNEDLIDAATSATATGAGFAFYFAEQMLKGTIEMGFSPEEAEKMVGQTMLGAMTLWEESGKDVVELREQVTSKGGTTAAGFEVFDQGKLGEVIVNALKRARERAVELSTESVINKIRGF